MGVSWLVDDSEQDPSLAKGAPSCDLKNLRPPRFPN